MTTLVEKSVKSAGGDYSTLSGWESGQQGNLTISDTIQRACCYDFALSDDVAVSGWTTSATQYPEIRAQKTAADGGATQSGLGHSRDVSGSGFQISNNASGAATIRVVTAFTRVIGLNIKSTDASQPWGTNFGGAWAVANDTTLLDSCVLQAPSCTAGYALGDTVANLKMTVQNNVIYIGGTTSRLIDTRSAATASLYFNTAKGGADLGFVCDVEATVKDNFCFGFTSQCFWNGGTPTGTFNASSDSSANSAPYSSGINSLTASNELTNVTGGSEDYSLKGGNHLAGAGTAIGGITVDIAGTTRSTNDIGAFAAAGAADTLFAQGCM